MTSALAAVLGGEDAVESKVVSQFNLHLYYRHPRFLFKESFRKGGGKYFTCCNAGAV
jgi:hypothetical protein